jgi:hypothetical protein
MTTEELTLKFKALEEIQDPLNSDGERWPNRIEEGNMLKATSVCTSCEVRNQNDTESWRYVEQASGSGWAGTSRL